MLGSNMIPLALTNYQSWLISPILCKNQLRHNDIANLEFNIVKNKFTW